MNYFVKAVIAGLVVLLFTENTQADTFYFPIKDKTDLTCHFCGYRYQNGICHNAIDIDTTNLATKIYAANDGEVIKTVKSCEGTQSCYEKGCSYGNHVVIRHPTNYTTLYAHLKYGSIKVKVGNQVKVGEEIATGDTTGCAQGSHLHFEVRDPQGKPVDPYDAPQNHNLCVPQKVPQDCGPNHLWATCPPQPYDPSEEDQNQDKDNDGFTFAQGDCDDNDLNIHPQAKEKCNNKDDNCDGQIDENWKNRNLAQDLGNPCVVGKGECQNEGMMVCDGLGVATVCSVDALPSQSEICDNKDNDCDEKIDEDFFNKGKSCAVGQGECQNTGEMICAPDGKGVVCSVDPLSPQLSACDGKDNDCDGMIDEREPVNQPLFIFRPNSEISNLRIEWNSATDTYGIIYSPGGFALRFLEVNLEGEVLNNKIVTEGDTDFLFAFTNTSDGYIVIWVKKLSFWETDNKIWFTRLDSHGNIIVSKVIYETEQGLIVQGPVLHAMTDDTCAIGWKILPDTFAFAQVDSMGELISPVFTVKDTYELNIGYDISGIVWNDENFVLLSEGVYNYGHGSIPDIKLLEIKDNQLYKHITVADIGVDTMDFRGERLLWNSRESAYVYTNGWETYLINRDGEVISIINTGIPYEAQIIWGNEEYALVGPGGAHGTNPLDVITAFTNGLDLSESFIIRSKDDVYRYKGASIAWNGENYAVVWAENYSIYRLDFNCD